MPLDRAPSASARQVLPTLNTSAQMWGLPGVFLTGGLGTGNPGASYVMVEARRALTVTSLMSWVTTGPGSDQTIRFGVWQHDASTGKPGTLVTDFGTVAVVTSATGMFSVSGTAALTPGEYWFGMRESAYMACRTWPSVILGVSSTGVNEGPNLYGAPSAAAFGNAPSIAGVDQARTFLLARWT